MRGCTTSSGTVRDDRWLPDTYNGLGFKNFIYMVVEVLDLQARWKAEVEKRAPLHLIFIEEPEAHLHTQLQQVFIRNILDLLKVHGEEDGDHSPARPSSRHTHRTSFTNAALRRSAISAAIWRKLNRHRGAQPVRVLRGARKQSTATSFNVI